MRVANIVFLLISQAIHISVYSREYVYRNDPDAIQPWYKFYHRWNDTLLMDITLENIELGVTAGIHIKSVSDTPAEPLAYRSDGRRKQFLIKKQLSEAVTVIYVKICTNIYLEREPFCLTKILAEGVSTKPGGKKDVCVRDLPCVVIVDLKGELTELTDAKEKIREPIAITISPSNPASAASGSRQDAATTIVTTVGSTAVLILLVVIAVWRRCWCKCDAPGKSQSRINFLSNRFYVNLLFRKECDDEIREIEQHRYEEIEQQYEEIVTA